MWFKKNKKNSRACEEWSDIFYPKFLGESNRGLILNLKKNWKKKSEKSEYRTKTRFFTRSKTYKVADISGRIWGMAIISGQRLERYIGYFRKKFGENRLIKTSTFEFSFLVDYFDTAR